VFVDLGDGRLAPREVTLGARAGDWYEVRGGLGSGERVVTSGNFLVAAESRLRSATEKW
jgi:Cu(I)/Ag(I) efflux system membrane fusion protein